MLSNSRQNAVYKSTVVSAKAPLASVDVCEVDMSSDGDDDDKNDNHINNNVNNSGLAASTAPTTVVKEQWPNKRNASEQHVQDQSESDVLLTSSTNGYRRPRPSTINLQPITSAAKVNENHNNDTTDGCFSGTSEDSEHGSSGQGINIQFHDIIHRARREISWDRCKCVWEEQNETKRTITKAIQFQL